MLCCTRGRKKKKKKETETVRSLFLAGDVQVWHLKAASGAATAVAEVVEAFSVLGGIDSKVGLKPP